MIRFVTFGMLCGATAAVVSLNWGGGLLMSLFAYGFFGSVGLMAMALRTYRQD